MKKQISLLLALVVAITALVIPTNAFAASTHTVKINGMDKLEITNVIEAVEYPGEEIDTEGDIICQSGAKLINLEDNAIALVFHNVHDPENGSSSVPVAPDGYTEFDLNEYGQFFDLPKGASYTIESVGTYYYEIQFADGTVAVGYIQVMDGYVPIPADPVAPQPEVKPDAIPVVSKAQRIQIEEEWADVDAYNIYDNNYIKLRDFAFYYSMFGSHTDKWFDVTWDGEKNAINLVTGKEYTPVGGEGELNAGVSAEATLSTSMVYLNGEYIPLTAYNINDNNYFKLRDLCEALDISISWWGVQQIIYINSDCPYGTEFEEIVPDVMW